MITLQTLRYRQMAQILLSLWVAMRSLLHKLNPTSSISHFLHALLILVVPLAVLVLTKAGFVPFAAGVVILSKWRMFAVRPRFWASNIRANSIDLMVGLSAVIFIYHSDSTALQLLWTALYAAWLIYIKPKSSSLMVTLQAFIGQFSGLSALYLAWGGGPTAGLTLGTGLVCYFAARHFFDSFDEVYAKLLSLVWGYFAAALGWLMSHWLLFYGVLAQPTLLMSALGFSMGSMYYLDHKDKLTLGLRRQFIFIMLVVVIVVLAFSDWGNKVV